MHENTISHVVKILLALLYNKDVLQNLRIFSKYGYIASYDFIDKTKLNIKK